MRLDEEPPNSKSLRSAMFASILVAAYWWGTLLRSVERLEGRAMGVEGQSRSDDWNHYTSLRPALAELFKAYDYAHSAKQDVWQLAVERATLRKLGLTISDIRWLVCMGYVKHAREITRLHDDSRGTKRGRDS